MNTKAFFYADHRALTTAFKKCCRKTRELINALHLVKVVL